MTSLLDNLDCSSDSEDINRLFPKCRSGGGSLTAGNNKTSNPDVNLNTLHDDCNDNRVLSLVMSGGGDEHDMAPPNAAPPSNLNGLVDADDEETEEEDDDMQDESPAASGGGSPPASNAEVPNGRIKYLRDSRIEIAGGRELYSQSKSKAGRAKRFVQEDSLGAAAAAVGTVQASLASGGRGGVWEVRGGGGGSGGRGRRSTHAQPPPLEMVTETVFSTEVRSIRRVSDASRFRGGQQAQQPVVYEAPVAPGAAEVVVFDDIGDCLTTDQQQQQHLGRQLHASSRHHEDDSSAGSSSTGRDTPPAYHRPPADFFKVLGPSGSDADTDPLSPERSRAPRVIGGLPIAEYEGSPRRYGPRQLSDSPSSQQQQTPTGPLIQGLPSAQSLLSSPSVFPPRPGFPQRVVSKDAEDQEEEDIQESPKLLPIVSSESANAAFDYLYEFSETRKVLEEFFKPSSPLPIEVDFAELDYNLHRQAGNSYVGQRLAAKDASEEPAPQTSSPRTRKAGGTPDLISLRDTEEPVGGPAHQSEAISPDRTQSLLTQELEITSNHADEDLAETEVGLQVGHSRNFTLSPETTDCDSNDIESEVSLENEGSMHSSGGGRLYGSMPVLEDGLSSGHASDTEDSVPPPVVPGDANPTIMLMKKQICEIEREIRSRAGNTKHEVKPTPAQAALDYRAVEDFLRGHDITYKPAGSPPTDLDVLGGLQDAPPPPAPAPHRSDKGGPGEPATESVEAAIKDIRLTLQRTKALPLRSPPVPDTPGDEATCGGSPIWVPRYEPPSPRPQPPPAVTASNGRVSPPMARRLQQAQPTLQQPPNAHLLQTQPPARQINVTSPPVDLEIRKVAAGPSSDDAADEEELDTDLETDRLLGQQRTDDQGFFDDKEWRRPKLRSGVPATKSSSLSSKQPPQPSVPSVQHQPLPTSVPNANGASSAPIGNDSSANNSDKSPSPQKNLSALNKTNKKEKESIKKKGRNKEVLIEGVLFRARYLGSTQLVCEGQPTKTTRMMQAEEAVSRIKANQNCSPNSRGYGVDDEDDESDESSGGRGGARGERGVGGAGLSDDDEEEEEEDLDEEEEEDDDDEAEDDDDDDDDDDEEEEEEAREGEGSDSDEEDPEEHAESEPLEVEAPPPAATAVISLSPGGRGVTTFRLQFLGSIEVEEEGKKHRKRLKKNMVEEAVSRVKAPEGENQPSTEVDLFISTEKIMVLNTDLKEIMMDHALRTISYIADIGDLVVLMARRRYVPQDVEEAPKINRTPKMICHVFESDEAQFIAQSIGQAFQVAYMEFLKANGIEDHSFVKEMDYQEVLNSQEIFGDELQMFAKKEMQKEVVVPKAKGEILGVVIVESGWGSMLPTVVIANLAPSGAAARCGMLNIGDQIIAINGVSLVGLPLSTCQTYIKNSKNQTVVKLTVVPCPPVVEVKIKRPDTKYQLGFSVQNGVICSLLRGGIAERGGVRVGHRIIEINNQSVVAVPHEKIVNLLATSVGEILMKTMPTSMFRLLTGQETPLYI
ncbi:histone-lysine N-methyltransferase SETD1B-like isoform X3 [Cloeon dipterum]|uniref:histone-lysine N-methyltransferase SETD1B-like isoform X3 n=1 Tax=Cloeon dipterum TaxID=197152 RepID=UPI00321FE1E9